MNLEACPVCAGFIPAGGQDRCPHCSAPRSRAPAGPDHLWKRIAAGVVMTASASGVAATLMACYGVPACDKTEDKDKDGFFVCVGRGRLETPVDCNDNDANIHPGAPDPLGDGVDQDCDGVDGKRVATSASASKTASPSSTSSSSRPSASASPPSSAPSASSGSSPSAIPTSSAAAPSPSSSAKAR